MGQDATIAGPAERVVDALERDHRICPHLRVDLHRGRRRKQAPGIELDLDRHRIPLPDAARRRDALDPGRGRVARLSQQQALKQHGGGRALPAAQRQGQRQGDERGGEEAARCAVVDDGAEVERGAAFCGLARQGQDQRG